MLVEADRAMATTMDRPATAPVHPQPRRPGARGRWSSTGRPSARSGSWPSPASLLIGFVFFHALGNLKVYLGAEDFNHYGEFLRELLVPFLPRTVFLWILRIGLIARLRLPHPLRLRRSPG